MAEDQLWACADEFTVSTESIAHEDRGSLESVASDNASSGKIAVLEAAWGGNDVGHFFNAERRCLPGTDDVDRHFHAQ